jgi:hypothetical protein
MYKVVQLLMVVPKGCKIMGLAAPIAAIKSFQRHRQRGTDMATFNRLKLWSHLFLLTRLLFLYQGLVLLLISLLTTKPTGHNHVTGRYLSEGLQDNCGLMSHGLFPVGSSGFWSRFSAVYNHYNLFKRSVKSTTLTSFIISLICCCISIVMLIYIIHWNITSLGSFLR